MKVRILVAQAFVVVPVCLGQVNPADGLFSVSNFWGRNTTGQFRQRLFEVLPDPVTNNYSEIIRSWFLDFVSYPDMLRETGKPHWMVEKSFLVYFFAQTPSVGSSTNCWYAAAELLGRYRGIIREAESNACAAASLGGQSMSAEGIQERFDHYRDLKMKAHSLKCIEPTLSNAVTNAFKSCILPLLPEGARMAVMTNVLIKAGAHEALR